MINNNEKLLKFYPIFTDNMETDYQVRFLDEDETKDCYNLLKEKSIDKNIFSNEFCIKENKLTQYFEILLK